VNHDNVEVDKAERKAAASAFVIHVPPDPFLHDFDNNTLDEQCAPQYQNADGSVCPGNSVDDNN
jgi:hypothetical protein